MKENLPTQVEKGLKDLSREEPEPFQFSRTMAHLEQQKTRRFIPMRTINRTAIGIAGVAILVVALLLIPVTYDMPVGSLVTVQLPMTENFINDNMQNISIEMENLQNTFIKIADDKMFINYTFLDVSPDKAAENIRTALHKNIPDLDIESIKAEVLTTEIGGNALAAIATRYFNLDLTGMSDAEAEAAIHTALAAEGITAENVSVQTEMEGDMKKIEIQLEGIQTDNPDGEEIQFDFNFGCEEDPNCEVRKIKQVIE